MKELENDARLFDLITQKSYHELTHEEQTFVATHLSEAEYQLQRTVIAASSDLTLEIPEPEPLRLPKTAVIPWYRKPIPLYQAAAAAVVLLCCTQLVTYTSGNKHHSSDSTAGARRTEPLVQLITDTVIREIPVPQVLVRYIHDTVQVLRSEYLYAPADREIQATRELYPIPLDVIPDKRAALSVVDDKSSGLLSQVPFTDKIRLK